MNPTSVLRRVLWFALVLGLAVAMSGCAASPRLFVNRQADMTLYKRVVMVPFANLSTDPFAPGRILRDLTTELTIANRFQMVDPSLLLGELERTNITPDATGQIELSKLRDAATRLKATAVIRGSVIEYGMRRDAGEEYPVVAFDAEMVDVQTGIVVWRISIIESGKGRIPVIGGGGERTFSRVTEKACKRAVDLLRERVL